MFTSGDALTHGLTRSQLRRAEQNGRITRVGRGVYAISGVPITARYELARAVALAGRWATVSHRAAAAAWGLPGGEPARIEISVPRWRRAHPAAWTIHESMDLTPADRTTKDGLPTTMVLRTLIDLGTWIPDWQVDASVNDALRRGLITLEALADRRAELGRRGRNGVGVMRQVLESRGARTERSESALESRAWRILREGGLPQPDLQHEVWDGTSFVARLDGAYPTVLVGLEVDGYRYHGDREAQSRDRARRNWLESVGWSIVNIDAEHLSTSPTMLVARIRRLCRTRASQLGVEFP